MARGSAGKLGLDSWTIAECRKLAKSISAQVHPIIEENTTVSIERTVLRLIGVKGALEKNGLNYPLPNFIVDQLVEDKVLDRGAIYWFANAMIETKKTVSELTDAIASDEIRLSKVKQASIDKVAKLATDLCAGGVKKIDEVRHERDQVRKRQGDPLVTQKGKPIIYVIVATGNIFEDRIQAKAAAEAGADAIAVIRSTAQSLLDYVPEGATTEGFGGTYATQENFKIMRAALDEVGAKVGRYIRLTNYSSGLCMAEIAAMGAIERLDYLLNDSMYGILFRDINPQRTLIDQHFSRRISARADITIQTGEDNYLTTADAVENGQQVVASEFINECFALEAGMKEEQMALGHAAEIDPWHPNAILLEIARSQMTRDLFPKHPLKFMPPTKYKVGDIFFSHVMDAMFNLVGIMTNQGVQLLGMPTEAMHTPLLMDRWMSVKNAKYIFGAAKDLSQEIEFKENGIICGWAEKVLDESLKLLQMIEKKGFFKAVEEKAFAEVSRSKTGGKGLNGVIKKSDDYLNPFFELL